MDELSSDLDEEQTEDETPVDEVSVSLRVVLGETTMSIHELLRLGRGAIIGLDTTEDDDVRVFVGDTEVAGGQLRLNGEQIEVIVTEARLLGPHYRTPSDPFKKVA